MKKIINGKKYDATTARLVCERDYYDNGNWFSTSALFRKKTGEFFIFHNINQRELWAKESYIDPITKAEALKFAEENMDGEDYEAFFGEVEE